MFIKKSLLDNRVLFAWHSFELRCGGPCIDGFALIERASLFSLFGGGGFDKVEILKELIFFIFFEIPATVNFAVDLFHFAFGKFEGLFRNFFQLISLEGIFINVAPGGGPGPLPTLPTINLRHKKLINKGLKIFGRGIPMKTQQIFILEFLDF
jgi:hypothetical protein